MSSNIKNRLGFIVLDTEYYMSHLDEMALELSRIRFVPISMAEALGKTYLKGCSYTFKEIKVGELPPHYTIILNE